MFLECFINGHDGVRRPTMDGTAILSCRGFHVGTSPANVGGTPTANVNSFKSIHKCKLKVYIYVRIYVVVYAQFAADNNNNKNSHLAKLARRTIANMLGTMYLANKATSTQHFIENDKQYSAHITNPNTHTHTHTEAPVVRTAHICTCFVCWHESTRQHHIIHTRLKDPHTNTPLPNIHTRIPTTYMHVISLLCVCARALSTLRFDGFFLVLDTFSGLPWVLVGTDGYGVVVLWWCLAFC